MTSRSPDPGGPPQPIWSPEDLREDPHGRSDKARRVRSMFAAIASSYDLNNRIHSFGMDRWWRRRAIRMVAPVSGLDVVDVACGTGDLSEAFDSAGARSVLGVDFTPEMLEVARERSARGRRQGISYREGDAMALDLEDDCCDLVSIAFGIRNVARPAAALAEFRRILRPGGRLLVLEFSEPQNPLIRWCNRLYTNQLMPRTAALIARDRSGAYGYLPKSVSSFMSRTELSGAIREAGFRDVLQLPMTFGVCVAYLAST
ncbi:MAG: bifunctional demethylmenaquinone methyltransferase/2-methoxy-6-polyprenyl-1,4-benzoquinol methylase UbiE [Planctomycetota bacterium]|nr:bifunctional demethylmenaquinone methyltransferase/2-methoxy-6-polyprenyl-1,4-benzoquinol methylase UbiE [Planctomycetota bacterium]MEC9157655.1 bifunctional demethylmenaquinone methyltransferase/2-methoxy-6-polyprenyl-1,4-benzoquinol methylase UbiE [Planctomycetota bacterium]MEC9234274.1 bifunctional demethylmenaquinone methyltransferase/2-methoxy-6-polyprenyl-1,4-benzoquinol methylase UbiE [Planctomycetota bacterium]MED6308083.1 bifunctional demethylmenaquinone methyltransferase/2-methoxy-6